MRNLSNDKLPKQAMQALKIVEELLESSIVGVYLFGSAVKGGLRINSDIDVLVVVNQRLSEPTRKKLTENLMSVSGKIGDEKGMRYLELTVINEEDSVPWQYPPRSEFVYGEWLRSEFENGQIPEPNFDPDLAIVLAQAREHSVSLFGTNLSTILDPIPITDIRKAIKQSLPELIEGIKGDERNVILTLARMWQTMDIGEISPKDVAADWALPKLPKQQAEVLDIARRAYLGKYNDDWDGMEAEIMSLVNHMRGKIESYFNIY
ncbi:aminoglycoside nucleotidyltransferase ANT(9) [Ligilactobacillus pobuzihii]|uniref:Spectinomycin 9-adenylyltransferase n=1 Tax=Ligilactobacillus pobuzihii TaxID=449659 RepID=A0A0R2L917_9LACO|nr:aminoglycoside nucleotidyltransferase ANT(9) [Ligilactobacillus pobuzihii]KRK10085.1 streptomycin 3-adenylyltransferase [Ligilactobacillus pobuzihii E100301 = KCTC 13174]KRN96309.1 streptomycin 3-adenylyltransferase [Ligilactobacillus pobuzihii]GEN48505.1 aminoglycoside nucleotidyltransferase ANT9 [Ligilactobacillus pobuzihii]